MSKKWEFLEDNCHVNTQRKVNTAYKNIIQTDKCGGGSEIFAPLGPGHHAITYGAMNSALSENQNLIFLQKENSLL